MEIQLGVIEARYADMIWEHELVTSSELVKMTAVISREEWRECILDCGYDTGHMELLSGEDYDKRYQEILDICSQLDNTLDSREMGEFERYYLATEFEIKEGN